MEKYSLEKIEIINENFSLWLNNLAKDWGRAIEEVALFIGNEEITNRTQNYPNVAKTLTTKTIDLNNFSKAISKCWALGGRFDSIHLNSFINNNIKAIDAINNFIRDFPMDDSEAAIRIDNFIHIAVKLGFNKKEKGNDLAGAALFASTILTSLYPMRFVDFRYNRWEVLAKNMDYDLPPLNDNYGTKILWAGKFAKYLCETETYKNIWPTKPPNYDKPLWVISGICWKGLNPEKPDIELPNPYNDGFPEGQKKRILHESRERSRKLVQKAKEIALKKDPLLCCEICDFSFKTSYNMTGDGFIEAHHKTPVAELKENSKTQIEDLALVCANCHRMLHYYGGNKTLSIEELKNILNN